MTEWWSGVDSNPRAAKAYLGGIRPEFGALSRANKCIRAGENLFARGSALLEDSLRFPSFARLMLGIWVTSNMK